MYPPKFDYYRADSVQSALDLIKEHDGKFLAGGHSLIPVMNLRLADPGTLIDIGRIPNIKGIDKHGNAVNIGALTTHTMVAASGELPTAVSEAASMIGDPQVRNRGTLGGNVAHADPASDMPTVLLALRAQFTIAGANGERIVDADDFFVDLFETALQEGELLVRVSVPVEGPHTGSAYAKLHNPASRYAMVGAAATVTINGGKFREVGVAVGGLTPKATRASAVEAALAGQDATAETIAAAAAAVADDLGDEVMGDIHASEAYRRQMAPVFVRRALETAVSRAS
ncbi:MAG: xanthine dehydrogenase family protein subunit M [Ardenticatenaceae bacterium]|nr:xanthine dehydrogenase family protein subunit M [Ardenticatenaceae bacterium]MCB8946869.1 xanthine dehydrogenase family protein subunit M [Ardenticatenaceae bacterium]